MKMLPSFVKFTSLFILLVCSCSKKQLNEGALDPDQNSGPNLEETTLSAQLIYPENNSECTSGIAENVNQSRVTFEWQAPQNSETHEIWVRNLNSNDSISETVTTQEASLLLHRSTPYAWYVISTLADSNETLKSDIWRFYNEGPGVENYAPFPAEAVSPRRWQTLPSSTDKIDLEWRATDVDDDIVSYEIFFGTNNNPSLSLGVTDQTRMEDYSVTQNTIYYWKVLTTDSNGNRSESAVFSFRVL